MDKNKFFGGIFGVITGDALGIPVQFLSRDEVKEKNITGMTGYGTFNMPPGTWSDDSSLTLCLIDSLINGYNLEDIGKKFIDWYDNGLWTPFGKSFDIGRGTRIAMKNLKRGISPKDAGPSDEYSNGNGSLMRILPLAFYVKDMDIKKQFEIVHDVSSITHGHSRSKIACGYYIQFILQLLKGNSPQSAYINTNNIAKNFYKDHPFRCELNHFSHIFENDISKFSENKIRSSGYVVDSLTASLWSFLNSSSFNEAVLKAVNLGEDTDTIGAITGGMAGTYYGLDNINKNWIETIIKKDDIFVLLESFYKALEGD